MRAPAFLDLVAELPNGARFRAEAGASPAGAGRATVRLSVLDAAGERVAGEWPLAGQARQRLRADLAAWAGQTVRLRLEADGTDGVELELRHAAITGRPGSEAAHRLLPAEPAAPPRSGRLGRPDIFVVLLDAARADAFRPFGGRWASPALERLAADGTRFTADQVICALPAHAAAPLVAGVDETLGRLCEACTDTSIAVVVLAFPRSAVAHPLRGSGFVVPRVEPALSITAATWISSKWPGRAPDDHVLLRGFVGGARQPDALALSDGALVDVVRGDLTRLLGIRGEPALLRVYRWPRANPQHNVGHLARVAEIDRRLARTPGLQIIGAAFRGVGIADCVAAGRAAGRTAAEVARSAA